jgi:hypothetical protein
MTTAGLTACTSTSHHAPSGLATLPAASILEKMIAATSTAGPVHVNVNDHAGSLTVAYSDDSLPDSGRQVITISNGAHAVVLVLNAIGYVQANSEALTTFFGLPEAVAAKAAGRWISFKQGQPGYQAVTAGVTVPGIITELRLGAPLSKLPATTTGGSPVVRIRGVPPAADGAPAGTTVVIDIAATGRVLPVSMQTSFGNERSDVTFSNWGETVHLSAPVNPRPISSLLQSGPSATLPAATRSHEAITPGEPGSWPSGVDG